MGDNELIKVGFSRRQADAIQAEASAGGGGGGVLPTLELAQSWLPDGLDIDGWNPGLTPQGKYLNLNTFFFPDLVASTVDTAVYAELDEWGNFVYAQDGLYLNSISIAFQPTGTASGTATDSLATLSLDDGQYLSNQFLADSVHTSLVLTWVTRQDADDSNTAPYITRILTPRQVQARSYHYLAVKLS
jgi:hypothetical protein